MLKLQRIRLKRLLSIIIVAALVAGAFFAVANPSTGKIFAGQISVVNNWNTSFQQGNSTVYEAHFNISIEFSLPYRLDPARIEFVIQDQNKSIELFKGVSLNDVSMVYSPNSCPHWLTTVGQNVSTEFNGNITDPAGTIVGGYPVEGQNGFTWNNGPASVLPGAVFHLEILSNRTFNAPYLLTLIYEGGYGEAEVNI